MRPANCVGSSKLKAVVRRDVSKRSQIRSFTVLSDLSADVFFFNSFVMECVGLTSIGPLGDHVRSHRVVEHYTSVLADQPYSDVVRTHRESTILSPTVTFSTLSPRTSSCNFVNGSNWSTVYLRLPPPASTEEGRRHHRNLHRHHRCSVRV